MYFCHLKMICLPFSFLHRFLPLNYSTFLYKQNSLARYMLFVYYLVTQTQQYIVNMYVCVSNTKSMFTLTLSRTQVLQR